MYMNRSKHFFSLRRGCVHYEILNSANFWHMTHNVNNHTMKTLHYLKSAFIKLAVAKKIVSIFLLLLINYH